MQPARGGGSGEGEGGANRAGLSRFRSAPATWLEALLEDEEEDSLKPNLCLTQLLTTAAAASNNNNATAHTSSRNNSSTIFGNITSPSSSSADLGGGGGGVSSSFEAAFPRQSSLPAGFLGVHDGFFSGFTVGAPTSFDLSPAPENLEAASSKRSRDLLSPIKLEQGAQGLIDMEMEKLLEDSVPCRVRAKRGFATHPRSIAERVRRTRISDRIRKLQELVPNMDKQTNTADMLEEAVEYVKHLRKQIEELTENQRRCKCTNNERPD